MADNRILLIHLGGLGDVCLSESLFLSLREHFGNRIVAVGTKRFFHLFPEYFLRIHGVESRHWLYLFSDQPTDTRWQRIVFIGKDRHGELRTRWQKISIDQVIFVDMYPEDQPQVAGCRPHDKEKPMVHVEEYQLAQLARYGIAALKKEIPLQHSSRVILYPEKGFEKSKWEPENFISLHRSLRAKGIDVCIMESHDLELGIPDRITIPNLNDVREFFRKGGGVFVSNDSGMAHLAGACGLATITIFMDYDPDVWRPRGCNISLVRGRDRIDRDIVEKAILGSFRLFQSEQ